jgi:hypothetical protein
VKNKFCLKKLSEEPWPAEKKAVRQVTASPRRGLCWDENGLAQDEVSYAFQQLPTRVLHRMIRLPVSKYDAAINANQRL